MAHAKQSEAVTMRHVMDEFGKRIEKHKKCIEQISFHREETIGTAESLEQFGGGDDKAPEHRMARELEGAVRSFAELENGFRTQMAALKAASETLASQAVNAGAAVPPVVADRDWVQTMEAFNRAERESEARKADSKQRVQTVLDAYRRKVHDVHHHGEALPGADDDDLSVVGGSDERDQVCPITQQLLTADADPLQNPLCRHTYSRVGIEAYLKGKLKTLWDKPNTKAGCPVAGCKHTVSLSALERAVALLRRLAVAKRKAQAATAGRPAAPAAAAAAGAGAGDTPGGPAAASAGARTVGGRTGAVGGMGSEDAPLDFTQSVDAGGAAAASAAGAGEGEEDADPISPTQSAAKRRRGAGADGVRVKPEPQPEAAAAAAAAPAGAAGAVAPAPAPGSAGGGDDPVSSASSPGAKRKR